MPESSRKYTYRGGQKIPLEERSDQFVVRALPVELEELGIDDAEQLSSSSSRISPGPGEEPQARGARAAAHSQPAYYEAETGAEFLTTDRIFVTFKQVLSPEQVGDFAGRFGLIQLEAYTERDYLFQIAHNVQVDPVDLVVTLTEDEPLVEVADHDLNYRASTYQFGLPTDLSYRQQWHLHNHFSHPDFDPRSSSYCEDAWRLLDSLGSRDVVVGVTDDGCKLDHADFSAPDKFAGWGYFQGLRLVRQGEVDADPAKMYQTGSNHGTSCAGVIAGQANGVLTVGAAPDCRLLPIKWESQGPSLFISDSKLLTALDYVADKVDVLSNSWGITPTSLWLGLVVRRITELARTGGRRGRGILFLWAAGNENCPIQHTAPVDIPFTSGWNGSTWVGVQSSRRFQNNLVGIPGLMHIAALASTAQRSHYSNYGTGIQLTAPSNNVHKYHRLQVRGVGITTTTGAGGGVTTGFGGTSSATPLVAGIAALVISANPLLSAQEAASVLKRTATKDLNTTPYPRTPPAIFDPNPTFDISPVAPFDQGAFQDIGDPDGSWSPWFGHGRVDAPAAVAAALQGQEPEPVVQEFTFSAEPDLAIPDNDPAGIESTLQIGTGGRVQGLRVAVEIEHTWIGDLRVVLRAPSGISVALHERSGSSQDNIRQTYTVATTSALASLVDGEMAGTWTLAVQDLARRDLGTLRRWSLQITAISDTLTLVDAEAVAIPDNDPQGITRVLTVPAGRLIRDIAVAVDITHPWIGDLRVILQTPHNSQVILHNRTGANADNIIRRWSSTEMVALQSLRGLDAGGSWRLQVADAARRDEGKLNSWQIEVKS